MLRPDEQANAAEVERDQNVRQNVSKGIRSAAGLAGGAIGARVLPLLSEYVPVDLAMRGLQKVAPKVADFLKKGQNAGLNIKEGMDFIKEQFSSQESAQEAKGEEDSRNLIEKHAPELHQFIVDKIKKGESFRRAGALARLEGGGKTFSKAIEKLMKEHKTSWEDIIEAIYGGGKPSNMPQPAQPQEPQQMQQPQQQQPQAQQGQQIGPGQQALIAALGKIPKRSVK